MGCKGFGVHTTMVGLHRVGLVGLDDALKKADASGLDEREAIVDLLVETLQADNYLPASQADEFRTAMWREYLRHRGEDCSEFFSEIEVTVRGEPGQERDRFMETFGDVIAEFELNPVVTFHPPGEPDPNPQLVIHGEVVVRGSPSRQSFKIALRKSVSDW